MLELELLELELAPLELELESLELELLVVVLLLDDELDTEPAAPDDGDEDVPLPPPPQAARKADAPDVIIRVRRLSALPKWIFISPHSRRLDPAYTLVGMRILVRMLLLLSRPFCPETDKQRAESYGAIVSRYGKPLL